MFERYTEKARRVIFFARYEASQFGSPCIESEHLLLGLLREDKALSNRFLRNNASVEAIRRQIEARVFVREKTSTSVDLPLANDCKLILAYAAEEAERLAHKHIGTEHILLGLLREENSFAAEILTERGLRVAEIREELAKHAHENPAQPASFAERAASFAKPRRPLFDIRIVDSASGETLLDYAAPFSGAIPRTGDSIALNDNRFRVEDVQWVYLVQPALPEDIAEIEKRIRFIVQRMENSIANHEFEMARHDSDEERQERENLKAARERHNLQPSTEPTETPQLKQVILTVVPLQANSSPSS